MIEAADTVGQSLGLEVWCDDEAGPFQTIPQPGSSWQPEGDPARQPHEYLRDGTAKILTRFHPADGQVRIPGTTTCPNTVLHPWLERERTAILAALPPLLPTADPSRAAWERWLRGLQQPITLPAVLPPRRVLLVLDNLAGHKSVALVLWLFAHGIMPLYTPVSGSWLNMAESIQRVLKSRAMAGQHPTSPAEIIKWFEEVAAFWNANPTPFVWGGKRAARRKRQRDRSHRLSGSGATTRRPVRCPKGHARPK
ncbi:transposase [Fimbriiglobus ruber]|uniref:Tc1-like transposase DDE domain-containing protein n=1 Tax=Fimbriiglobus ruber TaxID=1908690 RepID=A0A225DKI9_9BACT|nr:transposase [Fimbriiglobus ruber]OWK41912.1 hypothetical protein FRUB_03990 [Fimbriiglobus ruber]